MIKQNVWAVILLCSMQLIVCMEESNKKSGWQNFTPEQWEKITPEEWESLSSEIDSLILQDLQKYQPFFKKFHEKASASVINEFYVGFKNSLNGLWSVVICGAVTKEVDKIIIGKPLSTDSSSKSVINKNKPYERHIESMKRLFNKNISDWTEEDENLAKKSWCGLCFQRQANQIKILEERNKQLAKGIIVTGLAVVGAAFCAGYYYAKRK